MIGINDVHEMIVKEELTGVVNKLEKQEQRRPRRGKQEMNEEKNRH